MSDIDFVLDETEVAEVAATHAICSHFSLNTDAAGDSSFGDGCVSNCAYDWNAHVAHVQAGTQRFCCRSEVRHHFQL